MKRPSSISETISEDDTILPSIDELELDEDQCTNLATCFTNSEKKRRLGVDQVRALERHFEMENKLDPDRKTRLAVDLGLQPRQVAIWFQNRRARSKTKNLEKDFNGLKSRYDELLGECESLRRDKEALTEQLKELESKLDNSKSPMVKLETNTTMFYRDGASDSDSSIVFNEESMDQCFIDTYPTNLNFSCKGFLEQNFDLPNDEQNFDLTNGEQEFCTDTRFFSHEPISDLSPWNGSDKWVD